MTTDPRARAASGSTRSLLFVALLMGALLVAFVFTRPHASMAVNSGSPQQVVSDGGAAMPAAPPPAAPVVSDSPEQDASSNDKLNAGRDRSSGVITGGPMTGAGLGEKSGNDRACPGNTECEP